MLRQTRPSGVVRLMWNGSCKGRLMAWPTSSSSSVSRVDLGTMTHSWTASELHSMSAGAPAGNTAAEALVVTSGAE